MRAISTIPYRQVRYLVEEGSDYEYQPEIYPHTRTSNTWAMNAQYYLPWRAAAKADIRYFTDTWGIRAQGFQLGYSHPLGPLCHGSALSVLPTRQR